MDHPAAVLTCRPAAARRRRGAQMIEFALTLPLFIFLICFSLDAGRMILTQGALTDAAHQAARAGAQVGGGDVGGRRDSRVAFYDAVRSMPGGDTANISGFTATPDCSSGYVTVRGTYDVKFITPGLTAILSMADGRARDREGAWRLEASAVARCEIRRR